jgi:tRNA-dihydrouridine synthase A
MEGSKNCHNAEKPFDFKAHRFCIAPMMEWTDRHCRFFHRQLTRHAVLYTEMVTTGAVIHGDRARLMGFDPAEHPVALQLGGSDPKALAECARIGADFGYDEINLNVGCPSDRVQDGRFGACLMAEPQLVGDCVAAMKAAVAIPVTVKCRIGVDQQDDDADFERFIATVAAAGCRVFVVHARKAWLQGLSPKENREIPPLNYARVERLKREHPGLTVVLNGGLASVAAVQSALEWADGVMVGRAAYHDPYLLARLQQALFGTPLPSREAVIRAQRDYVRDHLARGETMRHVVRHWVGLYQGEPGARSFRRVLSERLHRRDAGWSLVEDALAAQRTAADDHQTLDAA